MSYSSSLDAAKAAAFLFLVILLAGKWSLAYSGLGALDVLSKPLTQTKPLQKQCCMSSVDRPLNIVGTEVPKYTVLLGRFHIELLGMSIGFRLESWSANTSFTWKYVPLSGKLPLIAVRHGIKIVPLTFWACASRILLQLKHVALSQSLPLSWELQNVWGASVDWAVSPGVHIESR